MLVGAVSAAVVEKALLGGEPLLAAPPANWNDARELIGFAIVGIVAGVVSGVAIALSHRLKAWLGRRIPTWPVRAATAGAVIGLLGLLSPQILGVGYDSVSVWLHGGGTGSAAMTAFGVKTVAFVLAVSAGVLGGTFAPSLFIGAALGAATGHALHLLLPHSTSIPRLRAPRSRRLLRRPAAQPHRRRADRRRADARLRADRPADAGRLALRRHLPAHLAAEHRRAADDDEGYVEAPHRQTRWPT